MPEEGDNLRWALSARRPAACIAGCFVPLILILLDEKSSKLSTFDRPRNAHRPHRGRRGAAAAAALQNLTMP